MPQNTKRETASNESVESRYDDYVIPISKSLDVPVRRASDCTLEDAVAAAAN